MHLSSNQSRALASAIGLLADANDADALRAALAAPMLDLLGADHYTSMAWNEQTHRFERFTALNVSPDSLRDWDAYFRFVDPLTFRLMLRRGPTLATQIMSQPELMKSEFFNDFLRREGMHWGVNIYFHDARTCVGDFRIWRSRERGQFGSHELELLRLLEPGITSALSRLHWAGSAAPREAQTLCAEELLERRAHLSRREAQAAWLVACGCPDKEIARRLGISYPTVRFHLGNVYRKLHAHNRAMLAARVRALIQADGDAVSRAN